MKSQEITRRYDLHLFDASGHDLLIPDCTGPMDIDPRRTLQRKGRVNVPVVETLNAAATPLAALVKRVSAACAGPMDQLGETVRTVLHAASAERALLSAQQKAGLSDRYARHLLHADPAGRFTIVSIVWCPGQYTPVHGHYTWCGYVVIAGTLREESFDWMPESRGVTHADSSDRFAGYACFANAGVDNVHRMANRSDCDAVSVHIYGVDGPRVGTHVNRLLRVID